MLCNVASYSYHRVYNIDRERCLRAYFLSAVTLNYGLLHTLKQAAEEVLYREALASLLSNPNIVVLGANDGTVTALSTVTEQAVTKRLPIFSFLIKRGTTRYLHYNFVCALLNDLFGIQARGGCMCAGPYAQRLLGLDATAVRALERQLLLKQV
jgi:selenocysteine lyase/cysteine desulfurase